MAAEQRLWAQRRQDTNILTGIITAPGGGPTTQATTVSGGLIQASALTTLTQTIAYITTGAEGVSTVPTVVTRIIANESQLSSALAEGISATPTAETTSTSSSPTAAATSAAGASKSDGANLGVLIPAIVAPVAVVLVISFGLFWWIMRRRAKKALAQEPEFVMEKRNRTRDHSRDDSTHSNSSTRKLVTQTSFGLTPDKEAVPAIREVSRPSMDVFSDRHEVNNGLGIGVAESPEHTPSHSRNNSDDPQNVSGTPSRTPVAVRNFSRGPTRPSTANTDRMPPSQQSARDRSMSNPGSRPMPPPGGMRSDPRNQQFGGGQGSMLDRSDPRRPPPHVRGPPPRGPPHGPYMPGAAPNGRNSPAGRPGPNLGPGPRALQDPMAPMDRSRNEQARHRPINPPPAIDTKESQAGRKLTGLSPPTPTGAYNGASPISQYSPIIKEHPKIDGSPPDSDAARSGGQSDNSPDTPQPSSSFTEENMRIARLADSSRLGFYKDTNAKGLTAIATSRTEESVADPPNPSPRLPPPATREIPPLNFPPPPPPPADSPTMPTSRSRRADSFANDRRSMRSMVSRLSDDEYVDMEVDDAKSDVSSLDEREKWDMEHEARGAAGSRAGNNSSLGGYGGLGVPGNNPRAPLVQPSGKNQSRY